MQAALGFVGLALVASLTSLVVFQAAFNRPGHHAPRARDQLRRAGHHPGLPHQAVEGSHRPGAIGLPLVATLDALFEARLISFADDGEMLVSARVPVDEQRRLGLGGQRLARVPDAATAGYLADHRARSGLGA